MKISLITTVKNEASSVASLIDAIRSQTRQPEEWIIVDGGSTDGSVDRLKAEPSCTVFVEPGNISQGRNRAIVHSTGEIIAVTDAGCRPCPNWLEGLVAPLEHNRGDFSAGPTVPCIESLWDAAQWTLLDQFFRPSSKWRSPTISSRSLAFMRKTWEECPYPEGLEIGEDRWMVHQWLRRGKKLAWVKDARVEWRLRPTFGAFLRQHFWYMRGDGQAKMRTKTNALRILFYLGLAMLATAAYRYPPAAWTALALWLTYLVATVAARFPAATRSRSIGFRLRALLCVPPALLGMDLAKIAGYLVGTVERLQRKRYTSPI